MHEIVKLLESMEYESLKMVSDFGINIHSQEYICNAIASLASKQAAICRILIKALQEK